jgi:hypothetical protein
MQIVPREETNTYLGTTDRLFDGKFVNLFPEVREKRVRSLRSLSRCALRVFSADFLLMGLQDFYDFFPTARFEYEKKSHIFYL